MARLAITQVKQFEEYWSFGIIIKSGEIECQINGWRYSLEKGITPPAAGKGGGRFYQIAYLNPAGMKELERALSKQIGEPVINKLPVTKHKEETPNTVEEPGKHCLICKGEVGPKNEDFQDINGVQVVCSPKCRDEYVRKIDAGLVWAAGEWKVG